MSGEGSKGSKGDFDVVSFDRNEGGEDDASSVKDFSPSGAGSLVKGETPGDDLLAVRVFFSG